MQEQQTTFEEEVQNKYIQNVFSQIIGTDLKSTTPYGDKNIVYTDYTASGRALKKIEEFISTQILPFYANVHSSCGYLSEQSENFRIESKSIVRRYFHTNEKDSIIYTGQGTTSGVNKLVNLMNLTGYVKFYEKLKILKEDCKATNDIISKLVDTSSEDKTKEYLLKIHEHNIEDIKSDYRKLFEITNFCYLNRWGSFDCILCRMTFSKETQYNEHETTDVHVSNLEKCSNINTDSTIFMPNFNLKSQNFIFDLIENYEDFEPIVFLSILEHNSNTLPWRETGAKIIYIGFNKWKTQSNFDYIELKNHLAKFSKSFIKIGSFTAASNLDGSYLDIDYLSLIMHQHKGLAFFDYATASPYVKINVNTVLPKEYRAKLGFEKTFTIEEEGLIYKDAVFFSPHKLLGGPNTPGVLIIKQHVVRNLLIPSEPGGGVVLFVRKERQNYVKNIEEREESGTPDIIGGVRIGLSLLIREQINDYFILKKELQMNHYIRERLNKIDNLYILGTCSTEKIPIYSFVVKFNGRLLHHNFVSSLLNDLFGIQSRPGCSCASTYGQLCLGLDENYLEVLERVVCTGVEIFRPGYVRLNFPYFYPNYITEYILSSIEFVCKYGWLFLFHYAFILESGKYYHRNKDEVKRKWLNEIIFAQGDIVLPNLLKDNKCFSSDSSELKNILNSNIEKAYDILKDIKNITKHTIGKSKLNLKLLFTDLEEHRWFLLPDDFDNLMYQMDLENILSDVNSNLINKAQESEFVIKFKISKNENNSDKNENYKSDIDSNTNIIGLETSIPVGFSDILISETHISNKLTKNLALFPDLPQKIIKLVGMASKDFDMLKDGDKILVGLSGGKDSISLLHALLYFQKKVPFKIEIAGVTVDPQSNDYDPSPMKEYMKKLGVKYFYESDPILERAKTNLQKDSICAYCARMKRGIIYNCARREGFNTIALGQHLDDLAESFLMSGFHNGLLRTMKANYIIDNGDLKVIRPLVYCREKLFKEFTVKNNIPVIQENCPACFSAPKERHRVKVLLAQQENIFPSLFSSLQKAMIPLMKGLMETGNKKDDIEI